MGKPAEKLKSWWISLTPDKRKTFMGLGCIMVLIGVLYLFVSAGPDQQRNSAPDIKADINLLTGSDTRTLGLEAVGAELKNAQRNQRTLEGQLTKMQADVPTNKQLDEVKVQLQALAQGVVSLKDEYSKRVAELEDVRREAVTATESPIGRPGTVNAGDAQRHGLFDYSPPEYSGPPSMPGARGVKMPAEVAEPIKVHVYGEAEPQASTGKPSSSASSQPLSNPDNEIYIPAGSILSGVLLTGVDAPTGLQSKRDPIPALMRVKHEAILPNRFRSDVRECFVVFGTTGELSTERALMRAETLSCIRRDGGVVETSIDAFAMGDDGKAGIRGRLVSRNGSLVAKAA